MKLSELKSIVDAAVEAAEEYGDRPDEVVVSIQINKGEDFIWSDDVELTYDCEAIASGCVIHGWATHDSRE